MRKGQLVRVVWRDIRTDLGTERAESPLKAVNVGCVYKQDSKTLWLKSGWYTDPDFKGMDTIVIPKGVIDRVDVLSVEAR